jgi:hypothetical protein
MPINTQLQLDTRTYEDLKRQALLRIPRYTPEWTDLNESDPGVTLVELFAWFTESLLYQMNQVPERHYLRFLESLGLELQAAEPAQAYVTFTPQPGVELQAGQQAISVPEATQVSAAATDGGPPLLFEVVEGLDLIRLELEKVLVFDGLGFTDATESNQTPKTPFYPLGFLPQPGSALYLGFKPDPKVSRKKRFFPERMNFRVFPLEKIASQPVNARELQDLPEPPVRLVWEYRSSSSKANVWKRLDTFEDKSVAFTREGSIYVQGPGTDIIASKEGNLTDAERYWLRVRVESGAYIPGKEPQLDFLRPNVGLVKNIATVLDEFVGDSTGQPDQVFILQRTPVLKDSLELVVQEPGQTEEKWELRPDFLETKPDDKHYVLERMTGQIRFGDGKRGNIPLPGAEVIARRYSYGGGERGNVDIDQITTIVSPLSEVEKVTNERPAVGGRSEETLEQFIQQAPAKLRHRDRAVSEDDFCKLAKETGGIARAKALPLFHPDHPDVEVPGAMTVVVIPESNELPPNPSPAQLEAVAEYLKPRRLLTTELYVTGPSYKAIRVDATVEANPYSAFDEVRREVIEAINQYLSPLPKDTNKKGWDFGQDLYPTSLFGVIQAVDDVRAVKFLQVRVDGQLYQNTNQPITLKLYEMLYGELEHDIRIVSHRDL